MESKKVEHNSDILFVCEAKMCNPNGDPDDENRPRMDYASNRNIVSDVRLKRYIRDYLQNHKGKEIFVSKVGDKTVKADERLEALIKKYEVEIKNNPELKDLLNNKGEPVVKNLSNHMGWLLRKLDDVRLFGATMPLGKGEETTGGGITFTGPVQFNWGYSLNKVAGPMDSSGITSTFAGAKESYGTMGKDYRVDYSLIAFHGIISAKRGEHTNLSQEDINTLDDAMVNAIPLEATTRSKIGQTPLIYIRVEYNSPEFFIGDLRNYMKIVDNNGIEIPFDETSKLRSLKDYSFNLSELTKKLIKYKDRIEKVIFCKKEELSVIGWELDDIKTIEKAI
jgi:CRISPR-associated protein Csh2